MTNKGVTMYSMTIFNDTMVSVTDFKFVEKVTCQELCICGILT